MLGMVRDITSASIAAGELEHSENRYHSMVKAAPVGVGVVALRRIIEVNDYVCNMLGYSREELLGQSSSMVYATEEEFITVGQIKAAHHRQVGMDHLETRWKCKDGRIIHVLLGTAPIDRNDPSLGIMFVALDMTDRKLADERIARSEANYRQLLEGAVDAFFHGDQSGNFIGVNEQSIRLTGYTRDELLTLNMSHLFNEEERRRSPLRYDLLQQGQYLTNERMLIRKDGSVIPVEMRSRIMPDQTYQCFMRDASERIVAAKALRESEERYRELFESAGDALFVADAESRLIIAANEKAAQLVRRSIPEIVGMPVSMLHPAAERERYEEQFRVSIEKRTSFFPDLLVVASDGSFWPVDVSSNVFLQGGRTFVLGIFRDISERKKTEATLNNATRLEALGVLAGGIAHDFNNLLGAIFGYMELSRRLLDGSTLSAGYLDRALGAINRARNLTQQLLTFSKGGEPLKAPLDIGEVLRNAVSFTLSGSAVQAKLTIPDSVWMVEADEGQLGQVLDNLLLNARQAMENKGTILVSVKEERVELPTFQSLPVGRYVVLCIQDRGPGIPIEVLPRIFDPFFTTKTGGSGLGLTTAYSIVKRHGGAIQAENSIDGGACFTLWLPASERNGKGQKNS